MSDRSQSVSGSNMELLSFVGARREHAPDMWACATASRVQTRLVSPQARQARWCDEPTALRADVDAGTERPVGIHRKPIKQHDLLSTALRATTFCSTLQSSVAATHNGVKNFSEIHFSLRRR